MLHRELPHVPRKEGTRYNYRAGVEYAKGVARAYQPRKGGPPLLFTSDIRMTLLVNLALADGPVRQVHLWRHLGKRCPTALYPLIEHGLVSQWALSRARVFVALDPCHPAAQPLRRLLLEVPKHYRGFRPIPHDVMSSDAGAPPHRPSRKRDVRNTFGDHIRTMSLLMVHVLGGGYSTDIARCVPYLRRYSVGDVLEMFCAFGLLRRRYAVVRKKRGIVYSFNDDNPLVPFIRDVLEALNVAMPMWGEEAERQKIMPLPVKSDHRNTRRSHKRWKW